MSGFEPTKGYDDLPKPKPKGQKRMWRFRMEYNEEKTVQLCDTHPARFHEHTWKEVNSYGRTDWSVTATCIAHASDVPDPAACPLCKAEIRRQYVGMLTVIQHTPWTDKEGKQHPNDKQIMACKTDDMRRFKRQCEKRDGDLAGAVYEVHRSEGQMSSRIGDEWEFVGIQGFPTDVDATPFDYAALFAPKSVEELQSIADRLADKDNHPDDQPSDVEGAPF